MQRTVRGRRQPTMLTVAVVALAAIVATVVAARPPGAADAAEPAAIGVPLPASYFTGSMAPEPEPGPCPPGGMGPSTGLCIENGGVTVTLDRKFIFVDETITATASSSVAGVIRWTTNSFTVSGCQDGDSTCTIKPYATGPAWRLITATVLNPANLLQALAFGDAAFNVDAHLVEGTALVENLLPPPYFTSPYPWPSAAIRFERTNADGTPTDYLYNGLFNVFGQQINVPPGTPSQGYCYFCWGSVDLNGLSGLNANDGSFRMFVPTGYYTLTVIRYPFSGEAAGREPLPGWHTPITFYVDEDTEIYLRRDLKTIAGRVTAPDGRPLAGVAVGARPLGSTDGAIATTDSDGRYSMKVERGSYDVVPPVERGRFNPTSRRVDVSQNDANNTDFVQETSRISGWLMSSEGPVKNWPVEALGPSTENARTDDTGHYTLELQPARWIVRPVGGVWNPPSSDVTLGSASAEASFECLDNEICGNPSLTLTYESGPSKLAVGEQATFTFTIANQGDVPITGLTLTGPVPVAGTGGLVLESGPTPEPPTELAPGDSRLLSYTVIGDVEGQGRYRWTVAGDADGEPVGRSVVRDVQIGHLVSVEVTPAKSDVVLDTPDGPDVVVLTDKLGGKHTIFKVTVRATNESVDELTNVRIEGGVVIDPVEELEPGAPPYRNSQLAVDRPEIELDVPESSDGVIGTLAAGAHKDLVFYLEALRAGTSPLNVLVVGGGPAGTVSANGTARVRVVQEILVELRARVDPNQALPRLAGQAVKVDAQLVNLTADKTIGVFPEVYYRATATSDFSNATNGYLYDPATSDGTTPTAPVGFVLQPGKTLPLAAIIGTLPSVSASQALVQYRLRAFEQHIDDNGAITWSEISTKARVVDDPDAGWASPITHTLRANPPEVFNPATSCGEVWGPEYADWTWCGLVKGIENFASGLAQLPHMLQTAVEYGPFGSQTMMYQARILGLGFAALLQDPVSQQELVDEVRRVMATMDFAANAAWTAYSEQIPGAVADYLARMDQLYKSGDENFVYELGVQAGENIDFFVEAPLKAGLKIVTNETLALMMKPALNKRLPKAVSRYLETRFVEAASKIANGEKLEKAAVPGMNAEPYLDEAGYGEKTKAAMHEIANDSNTVGVYKTRDTLADELIRERKANPKSEQFKEKTVKQIDIDEMGVPADMKATAVAIEPPFKAELDRFTDPRVKTPNELKVLQADLDGIVDDYLSRTRPDLVGEAREQLKSRWMVRSAEWLDFKHNKLPMLEEWKKHGIAEIFNPSTQEGLPHVEIEFELVGFDYTKVDLPDGGTVYQLKKGSKAEPQNILPQASDPDAVFYLDADSGAIADPNKRLAVMKATYNNPYLGTNHGETGSLFDPTGTLREKWMPGPDDLVIIVAPNEPARFGRVVKVFDEFILIDGTKFIHYMGPLGWSIPQSIVDGFVNFVQALATGLGINGWVQRAGRLINAKYSDPQAPSTGPLPVQQFNRQGVPLTLAPSGPPLAQFAPAAGGGRTWTPISYNDALATGTPGVMDPAPMTLLPQDAPAGTTRLDVMERTELGVAATSDWFAAGDQVVLDPGGANEEYATVVGLGSLLLQSPLQRAHLRGELVLMLPTAQPPDTSIAAAPAAIVNTASAEFTFTSNVAGATFECQLDTATWAPCVSPRVYSALPDGVHDFAVRSTAAGLTDATPATRSWRVDRTPPTVSIARPASNAVYTQGEVVLASYACADTGAGLAASQACVGTVPSGSAIDTTIIGKSRSFSVTATDAAGNLTTTSMTYRVDAPLALRVDAGAILPAAGKRPTAVTLAGKWTATATPSMKCGDDVTITLGTFTETIAGARFKSVLGLCTYVKPNGATTFASLVVFDLRSGIFSIAAAGASPTFTPFVNPVNVGIALGNARGSVAVTFVKHGALWTSPK
ncbi:MAG: carboxypeptidase-like regulatory domain-containing protein [Acidimicrobiales bacterium]